MLAKKAKIKVSFLFGAGAEGPGNYDIPLGYQYLQESLFHVAKIGQYLDALKKTFEGLEFFGGYKYTKHKYDISKAMLQNFLVARILVKPQFLEDHQIDLAAALVDASLVELEEDEEVKQIIQKTGFANAIRNKTDAMKAHKKALEDELREIVGGNITEHKRIKSNLLKALFDNRGGEIDFHLNVGLGGELDRYFHTIINPVIFGKNSFSKIFNYYWSCYFTIVTAIVKHIGLPTSSSFLIEGTNELDYHAVAKDICGFTRLLYSRSTSDKSKRTYYGEIQKALAKRSDAIRCEKVLTTNYFHFASHTGRDVVYLNGRLNLFELPELLDVIDCRKTTVKGLYFPFVFGQSLLKPIVHPLQMREFSKFQDILDNIDVLVVLGYRINEEDNHVNAFLRDYLQNDSKRLIVVGNGDTTDADKRLKREDGRIEYLKVRYGDNGDVVDKIMEQIAGGVG